MAKFTKRQMTNWLTAMEAAKRDGVRVNDTDYSGVVIERVQPTVGDGFRYAEVVGFQTVGAARFAMAELYGFAK
jgi:hypothetical protein